MPRLGFKKGDRVGFNLCACQQEVVPGQSVKSKHGVYFGVKPRNIHGVVVSVDAVVGVHLDKWKSGRTEYWSESFLRKVRK